MPEAAVETPPRKMIEKRETHGNVHRMVLGNDRDARAETNVLGLWQTIGDEDIVGRNRLPLQGVVLANPALGKPQLVGVDDKLQVFLETLRPRLVRGVQRHHEEAKLHRSTPVR